MREEGIIKQSFWSKFMRTFELLTTLIEDKIVPVYCLNPHLQLGFSSQVLSLILIFILFFDGHLM